LSLGVPRVKQNLQFALGVFHNNMEKCYIWAEYLQVAYRNVDAFERSIYDFFHFWKTWKIIPGKFPLNDIFRKITIRLKVILLLLSSLEFRILLTSLIKVKCNKIVQQMP
jgi:hypothetical protein